MNRKSVLILDNFPQTLAVIRSLGAANYNVILGHDGHRSEASFSRHCHETWLHPSTGNVQAFEASVCRLLDERTDIRWIFPVAEPGVKLILQMHRILNRNIQIAMVPKELFTACLDKQQANSLAASAGIAIPKTRIAANLRDLQEAVKSIGYPVIIKSFRTNLRIFDRKAYVINTPEQFKSLFSAWPEEHDDLMVQEFIVGILEASDFVAQDGTLVAYCEAHSERTDLPDGTGYGVEFRSIPPSPDVLAATRAFVQAHGYTGPGLIQFMRAQGAGEIFFLENNPRLSAGVADTIACGQDLPLIVLQAIDNEGIHKLEEFSSAGEPYRVNHYSYWFSRDITGYIRQRSGLSRNQRRLWLANILGSIKRADSHIMWQLRDPLPGILVLARLAAGFFRHLISR